jgi:hypothetical protein
MTSNLFFNYNEESYELSSTNSNLNSNVTINVSKNSTVNFDTFSTYPNKTNIINSDIKTGQIWNLYLYASSFFDKFSIQFKLSIKSLDNEEEIVINNISQTTTLIKSSLSPTLYIIPIQIVKNYKSNSSLDSFNIVPIITNYGNVDNNITLYFKSSEPTFISTNLTISSVN